MIRRLNQTDHDTCFELLQTNPAENLFIIGDIEGYGYDQEFQKVWGEFNDAGDMIAVLLKYENNYIPFALGEFNASRFAEIMDEDPAFHMMSGLRDVTSKIEPYLKKSLKSKRETYYAKCTRLQSVPTDVSKVKKATLEDVEDLVKLLKSVPEFSESIITVERKSRGLQDGSSRIFVIEEDEKLVSTASTTAENSMSAMVVGVATHKDYKKKGYATACMVKLCEELLNEGKELCLFYDNPAAGAIYKRIGFEDIGYWMMYTYND